MSARVFISHRSPDGRPPAEALARALGAVFGAQQVMLGRDDARGLAATPHQRARILACHDVERLRAWLVGALTCESVDQLLG